MKLKDNIMCKLMINNSVHLCLKQHNRRLRTVFFNCFVVVWLLIALGCTQSKPYFFVCLSDPQFGMTENNAGFSNESEMVAKTIAAINRLNPAFVVITGDLVNQAGNMEQIREFKRLFGEINKTIPIYCIPGNHDVGQTASDELLALYRSNFGDDRFSVSYKNTALIGFNSQLVWAKRDTLEMEQYEWLENELKMAMKYDYRFVFAHHPLFIERVDEEDTYQNFPADRRNKYINLFDKYKVQYLFAGHLHKNHIVSERNLTIIATNSVSVSHSHELPGFRIVKVYPDEIVCDYYTPETLPSKIVF